MTMPKREAPPPHRDDAGAGVVRVMVADDSAVVRGFVIRMLEQDPAIQVVASVSNGALAVEKLARNPAEIDVVVLDIEMPVMDGLTALGKLLAIDAGLPVVMASTLTTHNAEITLQALQAGAADYIPKPSARQLGGDNEFRRELVAKVKALAGARRRRGPATRPGVAAPRAATGSAVASRPVAGEPARAPVVLRAVARTRPEVIAIGSSTGGPQALVALLRALRPATLGAPLLITQHMPPTFTSILAEHLRRVSEVPCAEAQPGEPLQPGRIYVAPGDWHMLVESAPGGSRLRLSQEAPENYCRPSVDPMLRSLAAVYGARALCVILTGMGSDGLEGARRLVAAGGNVIAQDQATSVVWGMPGAVATAGLCCAVEPLDRLAPKILELCRGTVR